MTGLLSRLVENDIEDLKFMNYPALIKRLGPPENLLRDALGLIEPEVLELQGKIITPQV